MARQGKPKKQGTTRSKTALKSQQVKTQQAVPTAAAIRKQQQSRTRRVFTVIICVVVALGLMLPVTGLGFASCSASLGDSSNTPNSASSASSDSGG